MSASSALLLSYVMNVGWNLQELLQICLILGVPLTVGLMLLRHDILPCFSSLMTIFSLILLVSLIGGALAMLSTRSPAEVADPWLAAADNALPISAMEIVVETQQLPGWAISMLVKAYLQTGNIFVCTLIALHLLDRLQWAWRIILIWGWSFLAIALLSFSAPAIGCFSQLSNDEVAHLPTGAGRYAMRKFHEFRTAIAPILEIDRLGGVITFPSLHTVTAMMIAQAWHGFRILGPLTKIMAIVIIFSCVPVGGHYLVDLFAGMAVWWGVTLGIDRMIVSRAAASTPPSIVAAAA